MEEIFVPASGMAMEEARLTEWLKQPGENVAPGEPVAVMETDKASVELSSETAGVLSRHLYAAGSTVKAGATVAYVLAEGESEPGADADAGAGAGAEEAAAASPPPEHRQAARGAEADGPSRARREMSPRQRRAAALAAAPKAPPPLRAAPAPAVPASSAARTSVGQTASPSTDDTFRRAIAAQVAESWKTIPHFSVGRDVNARGLTASLSVARRYNRAVTVTDFLLSGFGQALARAGKSSDVGLAVATEWGVLIPVVRDAGAVPFDELARRRKDAVERARSRRLASDDSVTPYATLSNLGTMEVAWFTGVVPVGQKALLTIGEIADRPVVEGRGITVRPQFSATLTADHRELDGADSARLLGYFVAAVESMGEEAGA